MPTNTLSDSKCKAAKPASKAFKMFDGGGLHLWVSLKGGKVWRGVDRFGVHIDFVRHFNAAFTGNCSFPNKLHSIIHINKTL